MRKKPMDRRETLHHMYVVSAKQAQRMSEGRVESRPEDYSSKASSLDRERAKVRKALEERAELRELERACGDVW